MSDKAPRKKAGRKPGVKVTHGAYSLIARPGGPLPSKRRYIERWLSEVRAGLISDLGPTEKDLTTGQAILIDRVIGKLGVLRCIEEHVREKGVLKGEELRGLLGKNYLGWANSLRLDLLALGISEKNGGRILSPLEIAAEIDAEKEAVTCGPGIAQAGRSVASQGDGTGREAGDPGGNGQGGEKRAPGLNGEGRSQDDEAKDQGPAEGGPGAETTEAIDGE